MATPSLSRRAGAFVCQSCRKNITNITRPSGQAFARTVSSNRSTLLNIVDSIRGTTKTPSGGSSNGESIAQILNDAPDLQNIWAGGPPSGDREQRRVHRLHIYSHKHNTYITFVQPPKLATATASSSISATSSKAADQKKKIDVLFSLSTGNIGFKKAARGTYDAAFQLAAYALKQIQERGILPEIEHVEVVLRGFGTGREAATKAILGTEGRHLRKYICAVIDSTRLKLGGPRAKKPRRL